MFLHMDTNVLQEHGVFIFRVAPDDVGIRVIFCRNRGMKILQR